MYQLQQANRHLQQIEEDTKQLEEAVWFYARAFFYLVGMGIIGVTSKFSLVSFQFLHNVN